MSGQVAYSPLQSSRAQRAMAAWSNLTPNCRAVPIETLQEKKNCAVYRLPGAGSHGENVIAKWLRAGPCVIERTVYDRILARLQMPTPCCIGSVPDDTDGFAWLFVEEAAGVEYDSTDPAHRAIASKWLAELHSTAHDLAGAAAKSRRLPPVGLPQCAIRISRAKERIISFIGNPALDNEDRVVLAEVLEQCELLNGWCDRLDHHCRRFAPTLVHGDFVAKNLRICLKADQAHLLVFDWEMAGFGPPGADLAECDDLATYHASLGRTFRVLTLAEVQMLALIGKALRWAAAIDWASWGLDGPWVRKPMRDLGCYSHDMCELDGALRQAGLVS